ncbi:MAG: beta-galactosidase, partial [Lentisphaerae bacterium]|nr:beta-galactosidase [Lentisphaerota bacterium]
MCARQVHLDFHTSEHIGGIGARFQRRQFQAALQLGHVNSITVFAKCHHGWSYYPTKVGQPHPHLKIDLLKAQIEACHEIGVRAPIYLTLGWSAQDARQHPEWTVRQRDGSAFGLNVDA